MARVRPVEVGILIDVAAHRIVGRDAHIREFHAARDKADITIGRRRAISSPTTDTRSVGAGVVNGAEEPVVTGGSIAYGNTDTALAGFVASSRVALV